MKRIALVLVVLLAVSGLVFAEVTVGGDATVSGSVSTTVGYDLQNSIWGADGSSSITLKVPFFNGSAGAAGEDNLYGEISLSDIGFNFYNSATDLDAADTDADNPGFSDADYDGTNFDGNISAKIVAGDIYVGLNSAGFNFNNAKGTATFDVNLDDDWYAPAGDGNLVIGYDNGTIGFGFEVQPKGGITRAAAATANEDFVGAWDGETASASAVSADQNTDGEVVLGVDLSVNVAPVTLPVSVTIDPAYSAADVMLLGVGSAPSIALGDLTIDLPVDFVMIDTANGFDIAPAIAYALNADGSKVAVDAYYYNHDTDSLINTGLEVTEVTAGGFVDGLGVVVDVDLTDLAGTLGWGVDLELDYVIADGITVSVDPGYDSTSDFDLAAGVVLGAAATGIDNTEISLDYKSATFGTNADNGIISATAKVSF